MEFNGYCWDCPILVSHLLVPMGVAILLSVLAVGLERRGRVANVAAGLLGTASLLVLLGAPTFALRDGIDWRWSREDFAFVRYRAFDFVFAVLGLAVTFVVGRFLWR